MNILNSAGNLPARQKSPCGNLTGRYPVEYDAEIEITIAGKAKVRGYFLRDESTGLRT